MLLTLNLCYDHFMATKKQKDNRRYALAILLAASLVFNIVTLIIIPSHFSIVGLILLLTNLIALSKMNNFMKSDKVRNGVVFSLVYSLIYFFLVLYWSSAGASACSEFFGSYRSCLGSYQQIFIELFATPFILLTATQSIFKK